MKIKKSYRLEEKALDNIGKIKELTGMENTTIIENAIEKYLIAIKKSGYDINKLDIS